MAASLMLKCFLLVILTSMTSAQLPIPKRMVGYAYNQISSDAPIHLDIHLGPLCPDSAEAFPNAKAVAVHYGSKLRWTSHMFPLPYHHQAYLTAIPSDCAVGQVQFVNKLQSDVPTNGYLCGYRIAYPNGTHVVDHATSKIKTYDWLETIYTAGLDSLSNDATANLTLHEVVSLLASFAEKCCNIPTSTFESLMASKEFESATRTEWKYSCSRSVSGTPTYFLNDVPIEAEAAWTLSDWKTVIDPLLEGLSSFSNKTCPPDTKKCTYLPGKMECCTKGEACIPNVGCRC